MVGVARVVASSTSDGIELSADRAAAHVGNGFAETVRRLAPAIGSEARAVLDLDLPPVRFTGYLGFDAAIDEIVAVEQQAGVTEVALNRGVLASLYGPLPEPYQELCYQRQLAGDTAMASFLDIFNHRLNLLGFVFDDAFRPEAISSEASSRSAPDDELIDPSVRIALAPILARSPLSLGGACHVLSLLLAARVSGKACVGALRPVARESRLTLGETNHVLGRSALVGSRAWDPTAAVEIRVALTERSQLLSLAPGQPGRRALAGALRQLLGEHLEIRVVCDVSEAGAKPVHLGTGRGSSQLGHTSHLAYGASLPNPEPIRFRVGALGDHLDGYGGDHEP